MPDPKDRWEVVEEAQKKKWKPKKNAPESGYRTEGMSNCPTTDPELKKWILDMIDWGQMVVEDMAGLREELRKLKGDVDVINNELSGIARKTAAKT